MEIHPYGLFKSPFGLVSAEVSNLKKVRLPIMMQDLIVDYYQRYRAIYTRKNKTRPKQAVKFPYKRHISSEISEA